MEILSEKKLENAAIEVEIQVPIERVEQEYKAAYKKLAKKVKIDGFRKGMAPIQIIEKRYGESVKFEVAENLSDKAFWEAVEEKKYTPIAEPRISYGSLEKGAPFTFKAVMDVPPTVELGDYIGVKAEKMVCNITDEDIENEIDNMRERYAEIKPIDNEDAVVENDKLVKFKLRRIDNVEPNELESVDFREYSILVGKSKDKYTVDKHILGMKKGEEKKVSIKYPSDYYLSDFAGNTVTYEVVVLEISDMILPEIDDEFAKKIGNESVDELKAQTRSYLEKVVNDRISSSLKGEVLGKIVEKSTFDIPLTMVLKEMGMAFSRIKDKLGYGTESLDEFATMIGQDPEEYKELLRADAKRTIKNTLVLSQIAHDEKLTVPEEKYNEALQGYALEMGKTVDEIKKIIEEHNSKSQVEEDLLLDIAMDFVIEKGNISKSKEMNFGEFLKLQNGQ